jgi:aldehyde:ferredoxin oxidoreductase
MWLYQVHSKSNAETMHWLREYCVCIQGYEQLCWEDNTYFIKAHARPNTTHVQYEQWSSQSYIVIDMSVWCIFKQYIKEKTV